MYNQQEASLLRQKFWISFGRYMAPIPSSVNQKVNWINYRTGIKSVNFKMDAVPGSAYIAIEISHKETADRELYFNHFTTFKKALEEILNEKWIWESAWDNGNGNTLSRIYTTLEKVNVFAEHDWPKIISFLKNRIIALDKFWNEYKDIFEMLS